MKKIKTFEAGKNSKELWIDTTRKFITVVPESGTFQKWDILELEIDDETTMPKFKRLFDWVVDYEYWSNLAYYEEPKEELWEMTVKPVEWEELLKRTKELYKIAEFDHWKLKKEKQEVFVNKFFIGEKVFYFSSYKIIETVIKAILEWWFYNLTERFWIKESELFKTKSQLKKSLLKQAEEKYKKEIDNINSL